MEPLQGLFYLLLCGCSTASVLSSQKQAETCGYSSCHPTKPGMLNVHLLSHSHDDVGWLKTVDQYFLGSNRGGWQWENQKVGVQDVLDSVIRSLTNNKDRKYIQVETAFFWRWWNQQTDQTKDVFRGLVDSGQLEFVGGGWSMNDEGAAHYVAMVDQMSLGFKILNQTFGECGRPRVAWQVDPFGHSKEQAHLFKQMGFDGYFFGRLDYRDKEKRMANQDMEMVWQTSPDLNSELFTGVNYNVYWPPSDFCWDIYCNDEPMMDNPNLKDYNVDKKVDMFLAYVEEQAKSYRSENILVCFGMDFHYQASHFWFKNIDKLIKHVNARQASGSLVNLIYSTPSCYLDALNKAGETWPVKSDDFFPYASDDHAYWTGYFTSRPTSKRMMHESSQILQAAKQMSSALHNSGAAEAAAVLQATFALERAVGVAQHHDAITGTEKQHVADDYHETIAAEVTAFTQAAFAGAGFAHCPLLNVSHCQVTETSDVFTVGAYNPLARAQTRFLRMPVASDQFTVKTFPGGADVPCQTVPLPQAVLNLPGRESVATHDLVFRAEDLPALGTSYFVVERTANPTCTSAVAADVPAAGMFLGGGRVFLDGKRITKVDNITFSQDLMWYTGFAGDNDPSDERASGAYVFRPVEEEANAFTMSAPPVVYTGRLFDEVQEVYDGGFASQVTRIYYGDPAFDFEVEWMVGPINIDDGSGKEVINRVTVDSIANAGAFRTDANGRQMLDRVRDARPTFDVDRAEPVSANYYPVNSRITIDNGADAWLTVLNDRSQAGGSIHDGQVELLVHRRLLFDDQFGVEEPLNEMAYEVGLVARGKHYLLFDTSAADANARHRVTATEVFNPPLLTFAAGAVAQTTVDLLAALNVALAAQLPPNLHLLTLEPWYTAGEVPGASRFFLVRLEHLFQTGEHPTHSQPATVDVADLLSSLGSVASMKETTLGGNAFKETLPQELHWTKDSDTYVDRFLHKVNSWSQRGFPMTEQAGYDVLLTPMEIRTFVVEIA